VIMVGSIAVNLLIANSGAVDESIIQKNAGGQQQMPPTQNTLPPTETAPPTGTPDPNQDAIQNQEQKPPEPVQKDLNDTKTKEVEPAGP